MSALPEFVHTRRWWPADLMDETMPPGQSQPQGWLKPEADGVTRVRDNLDDDKKVILEIKPGEVVAFCWHEDRGEVEVTMLPDGTWKLDDMRDGRTIDMFRPHEPMQPRQADTLPMRRIEAANQFIWEEDWESQADTLDELVRSMADMDPPEPEGTRITIEMGFWSNEKLQFRVSADGKTLKPVDSAEGGKADRPSEPMRGPSAASGEAATSGGQSSV